MSVIIVVSMVQCLNRYVSDIKKTSLTRGQAEMLVRVANMLGDSDDSKLLAKAVDEILPLVRQSKDAELKRIVPTYEGIQRLLSLPGKPLESQTSLTDPSTISRKTPTAWWTEEWKSVQLAGNPPKPQAPPATEIDGSTGAGKP